MMDWHPLIDWYCTMMMMNAAMCAATVALYRNAPCWKQRMALAFIFVGTLVLTFAYALSLLGIKEIPLIGGRSWYVLNFGYFVVWLGVVMYIFRLLIQGGISHHGNRSGAS